MGDGGGADVAPLRGTTHIDDRLARALGQRRLAQHGRELRLAGSHLRAGRGEAREAGGGGAGSLAP